jgi:hypothetical protein
MMENAIRAPVAEASTDSKSPSRVQHPALAFAQSPSRVVALVAAISSWSRPNNTRSANEGDFA